MNFPERCKIKKQLNNRLKHDGTWSEYNALRAALKQAGVPEGEAWRVAAYPFPPRDGSAAEILSDPLYGEIAAGWADRKYHLPQQTIDDTRPAATATESISASDKWRAEFEKLAQKVGARKSSELDVARWVLANYLTNVKRIDPDDVPSSGALGLLMWVQLSPSNYGDFIRTMYAKLLPDKKAIEYENRFNDDGREDLDLIAELKIAVEKEEAA